MIKVVFPLILLFVFIFTGVAQELKLNNSINWSTAESINAFENKNTYLISGVVKSDSKITKSTATLKSVEYIIPTDLETAALKGLTVDTVITVNTEIVTFRKQQQIQYTFFPFRWNPQTEQMEKVLNYEIVFKSSNSSQKQSAAARTYASNSLLKSGNWYKIKVDTSGIFKLTYAQLKQLGLEKPENARIYSYGGRQLPYNNSLENYDDLLEIPVKVAAGTDGIFNDGDYLLFYAEGTTIWDYNAGLDMFIHFRHNYSKYTYLFVSDFEGAGGMRMEEIDNSQLIANATSTSFDSYKCHESDIYNLIGSGRTWYGEKFRTGSTLNLNFGFPNIISTQEAKIYTRVAGRKQQSSQSCLFTVENNKVNLGTINISGIYTDYVYATEYESLYKVPAPSSSFNITYAFQGASSDMEGYLNYICINTRENLKLYGTQFPFRDKLTVSAGQITEFKLDNNNKELSVWNITNPVKPYEIKVLKQSTQTTFTAKTDNLEQFIAFDGNNYFNPILQGDGLGLIENQDLHSSLAHEMIIVTHPDFRKQAEDLAQFHLEKDNLSVLVIEPEVIYNEFSSGTPDISAIRNFLRMLYDKATGEEDMVKYLLLFGDGSYDNRTVGAPNNNFIPTYQSYASLVETSSYVSDDYYGLLDVGEGEIGESSNYTIYGKLDIGIGRFPVQTVDEAELMVEKTKHYYSAESQGDWKTKICFIGDDEDGNLHQNDPEQICNEIIRPNNPEYNISKIYFDSFKQISTPSGQRYPDVTTAINRQVESGALLIDYVGHGNTRILAHEEVLTVPDIQSWRNWNKLSIFVTASCEVGRFDDYKRTSFGEWILLTPQGGGIAAFTTTRVVNAGSNDGLNRSFFRNVFETDQRLGDIIRNAKNSRPAGEINHRNFSLLGNPALRVAVPENKIVVGNINSNFLPVNNSEIPFNGEKAAVVYEPGDTINALSKAKVEGYIDDKYGNPVNDNGILYVTIYDKTDTLNVAVNDVTSTTKTLEFNLQDKILYKGKATITKGIFSFEFIVPKDINYKYGKGKISLYAVLDSSEAIGYSENIIIGGNAIDAGTDIAGPTIDLYMNDTTFKNGGITDENPILLAKLYDNSGINTTGIGFGHNITAILDGNQDKVYILNNYYQGDLDLYNSGEVRFPLAELEPGYHEITFKAFDIYNISTEASIEFHVNTSGAIAIENLKNFPNPFYDETYFIFDHNQGWDEFETKIEIFDLMGRKVNELKQKNTSESYTIEPILFYGTNSAGAKLPKGVYPYKAEITTSDGKKAYKSSKLVIFK